MGQSIPGCRRSPDKYHWVPIAGFCLYCNERLHEPHGFPRSRENRNGKLRIQLRSRDGNECWYCFRKFGPKRIATIDHVLPRCRGGRSNLANLVQACVECNTFKADKVGVLRGAYVGRYELAVA